jgi:hypothetical protein
LQACSTREQCRREAGQPVAPRTWYVHRPGLSRTSAEARPDMAGAQCVCVLAPARRRGGPGPRPCQGEAASATSVEARWHLCGCYPARARLSPRRRMSPVPWLLHGRPPDARDSAVASSVSPRLEPAVAPGAPAASGARCLASSSVAGTRAGGLRAAACAGDPRSAAPTGWDWEPPPDPRLASLLRGASSPATAIQARSDGPASGGTGGWSGEQGRGGGEGGGTSVAREAS